MLKNNDLDRSDARAKKVTSQVMACPEEERITTLTLSSVGAELFLDGDTFIRIPELAHQVFTLTNRNLRNQYSSRDAAFASTTDETMDIANSAEQILELARASA